MAPPSGTAGRPRASSRQQQASPDRISKEKAIRIQQQLQQLQKQKLDTLLDMPAEPALIAPPMTTAHQHLQQAKLQSAAVNGGRGRNSSSHLQQQQIQQQQQQHQTGRGKDKDKEIEKKKEKVMRSHSRRRAESHSPEKQRRSSPTRHSSPNKGYHSSPTRLRVSPDRKQMILPTPKNRASGSPNRRTLELPRRDPSPSPHRRLSPQRNSNNNNNNNHRSSSAQRPHHNRSISDNRIEHRKDNARDAAADKKKTYKPPKMNKNRPPLQQPLPSTRQTSNISQMTPPERVYLTKDPTKSVTSHLTFETASASYTPSQQLEESDTASSSQYHRMDAESTDDSSPVSRHRDKLNKWYDHRFPVLSRSHSPMGTVSDKSSIDERYTTTPNLLDDGIINDGNFLKTQQSIAVMAIAVTAVQLFVLMLQIAMCGLAPIEINPMVGPMPDAFVEWGGKNAYLILYDNEWWRLITPSFLHVGVLHLLVNAFCQLEAIALFEREWGSLRWILVYIISSVGCNAFGCYFDQNSISVGSSGALMGIYGAKLAQVACHSFFDVAEGVDLSVRLDHLSSVLCGLTLVTILSALTYIDWSGQMGGFLTGFLTGMFFFGCRIRSCFSWFFWNLFGLLGLPASIAAVLYFFVTEGDPVEDIGNACEYYRSLFPEGYECGCMW